MKAYTQRLLPRYREEIERAQEWAPYLGAYRKHARWLPNALDDLESGKRVAIGLFIPEVERTDGHGPQHVLAGHVLLRHNRYTGRVELKNLIVYPTFVEPDEQEPALDHLLNRVSAYCETKGFRMIETEVPFRSNGSRDETEAPDERDLLSFFHRRGFAVENIVRDRFERGDMFYRLHKQLRLNYAGDPLDFRSMVEWVLDASLPQFVVGESTTHHVTTATGASFLNSYDLKLVGGHLKSWEMPRLAIEGTCLVNSQERREPESLPFPEDKKLRLYFSCTAGPEASQLADSAGAYSWNLAETRALMGARSDARNVFFPRSDVGGMFVTVGQEFMANMEKASTEMGQSLVYFLFGGLGKYADSSPRLGTRPKIFFSFPSKRLETSDAVVHFVADLIKVRMGEAHELWDEFNDSNVLLSQRDLLLYSRHHDDKHVVALVCQSPERVGAELSLQEAISEAYEGEAILQDASRFFLNPLQETGVLTTYIPHAIRDALERAAIRSPHPDVDGQQSAEAPTEDQSTLYELIVAAGEWIEQKLEASDDEGFRFVREDDELWLDSGANRVRLDPAQVRSTEIDIERYQSVFETAKKEWSIFWEIPENLPAAGPAEKARLKQDLRDRKREICQLMSQLLAAIQLATGCTLAATHRLERARDNHDPLSW